MELNVKNRTVTGKKVRKLRKEGLIPAEIFGHGIENRHISIDEKEFKNVYKKAGSHTIVEVITENGENLPILISEVQYHPLTQKPLSVLMYAVRADEAIETRIPIKFKGSAPALRSGFMAVKVLNEIEIKALPDKIPHDFEVDLSGLEHLNQSIKISNLNAPLGVKILTPKDTVIVTITEKTKEEEPIAPGGEAAATEEKKEEGPTEVKSEAETK